MAARSTTERGEDTRCLRELILEHLHPRFGKTYADIREAIRFDFGTVGERRLQRQILILVRMGCIRREGTLRAGAFHFLVSKTIALKVKRSVCSICGAPGTNRGHPLHLGAADRRGAANHMKLLRDRYRRAALALVGIKRQIRDGKRAEAKLSSAEDRRIKTRSEWLAARKLVTAISEAKKRPARYRRSKKLRNVSPAREPGGEHGVPAGGTDDSIDGQTRAA